MEPSPSSSGSFAPASDTDLPERLGPYRVLRRLATGGTSDVLLARAEGPHGFERVVVLKLLLQEFRDDETFERMFAREAAAYARLSHPAIVKLYDFFSDAGQLVMVLEYVDGLPLHKLRALLKGRGGALDDRAAMFVAARIFGALSAAHAAKDPQTGEFAPVIHRDVNPSNVLIPWDGHSKIADFGIAKVAGVDMDKTQAGFIKGTYGYMAPEQVRGDAVTVRTDVYAACLLLWELLAGRKAIVRGNMSDLEVLRAMAEPTFPTLAALRPDLPRALLDAVGQGLQADPDRRTVQAEDLANVLRASTSLEEGRQRLVQALAAVRPPSMVDDLAITTSRPSVLSPDASRPPDVSADATIPNPVTVRGVSSPAEEHSPEPARPPVAPPPPPPPPAPRPAAPAFGSTVKMANVLPPRPAAGVPSVATTTLKGLSSTPPGASPTTEPLPAFPLAQSPPPPPPPARTSPPSPPVAAPPHPPVPLRPGPTGTAPGLTPRPAPPTPASRPPPPPSQPPPTPVMQPPTARPPSTPPPPQTSPLVAAILSAPAFTPPPLAPAPPPVLSPPPGVVAPPTPPTPAPGPVAWTPELPQQAAPVPRGRVVALVAVVLGVATCVGLVLVLWARGRGTVYTPPPRDKPAASVASASASATVTTAATSTATTATSASSTATATATATAVPTATATTTAAATTSAPAASSGAAPSPSSTTGTVTVPESRAGHRVWVDKQIVGESPGTFTVRCGWHAIRVGSQGQLRNLEVPCGGDIEVR